MFPINDLKDYENFVLSKTAKHLRYEEVLDMAVYGLNGETGELTDLLKKMLFHGTPADIEDIKKELGDALFYLTLICKWFGLGLGEIIRCNVEKLQKRYPKGMQAVLTTESQSKTYYINKKAMKFDTQKGCWTTAE